MFLAETQEVTPLEAALTSFNDFSKGFLNGTSIFAAIPSYQSCDFQSDRMKANITQFLNIVKNITIDNYQEIINLLVPIGQDILNETVKNIPKCVAAVAETQHLTQKLFAHMTKEGYFSRAIAHATTNFGELISRGSKITGYLVSAMHLEAGFESGNLFNFVFLHDFILNPNATVLSLFKTQVSTSSEFAHGFVNGTNVFSAIPSYGSCDFATDRMKANVTQFVELAKNITQENYQEIVNQLIPIGQDILNETMKTLPKCVSAVSETQHLTQKLIAHIRKEGYIGNAFSHVVGNIGELVTRGGKIFAHLSAANHFDAGRESGSLFNFLFLHDFNATALF